MTAKKQSKRHLDVERRGWIYVITNLINGKEYVGQTVCGILVRWAGHVSDAFKKNSQKPLYRALRGYGLKNFKVTELWHGPESQLNVAEKRFVRQRKTFIDWGMGYNLTTGGDHYKMSKATIRKIRKAAVAQWADEVKRDRVQEAITVACHKDSWKKNRHSGTIASLAKPETHVNLSKSAKRRANTPEYRQWLSEMQTADWAKPDAKVRRKRAPEVEQRRQTAVTKALRSPKMRKKLSKAQKKSYAENPDRGLRLSASLKAFNAAHPEVRKAVGVANKGREVSVSVKARLQKTSAKQWKDTVKRERLIAALKVGAARRWAREEEHVAASKRMTEVWKVPAHRAEISKAIKHSHESEAYLALASEVATKAWVTKRERMALSGT